MTVTHSSQMVGVKFDFRAPVGVGQAEEATHDFVGNPDMPLTRADVLIARSDALRLAAQCINDEQRKTLAELQQLYPRERERREG